MKKEKNKMKEHKRASITGFFFILFFTVACIFVAWKGVDEKGQGSAANIKLGLDLAGGVSITYEADEENPSSEDMADTVFKLQERVGVYSTEADVYQVGSNRITVEIPGVYDADAVLENLGNPGSISFQEKVDTSSDDAIEPSGTVLGDDYNEVLTGDDIQTAAVRSGTSDVGNTEYYVQLTLTSSGAEKFEAATSRNVGSPIYIVYDGEIISAPTVQQTITGNEATITGDFTYDEANSLATTIRLGVLKLSLHDVHSSVVGAKLGESALSTSLKAGAIGLGIVIIFMIVFYYVPGVAAGIALILYVAAMLCFLNALDVTLTLPGIAGIVLSIGMAVDANVVIFTRIREEIAAGNSVRAATKIGFKKATSAIVDGNVTTLIAAAILYLMGTGSIKGFATTLALGIVLSMFTAMVITRIVLNGLYYLGCKDEKFYGRQKAAKEIKFVQRRKIFYSISGVLILVGFVTMAIYGASGKGALNYSLEFTGGTTMTIETAEYIDVKGEGGDEMRQLIQDTVDVSEVQFQNVQDSNEIVIKTSVLEKDARADLKDALAEKYGVDQTSIEEESISATISGEMQRNAVLSVVISTICMLLYIWIRFRDWKFGLSAIVPLLHDVLIVLMVYAVTRISVGNTFIACMLTIVGYSVNSTIVIFDRIRENRQTMKDDLATIVNMSISQTLSRSINTSLTSFITIFVLFVMGVSSIREFTLPLMAGIVAGAWSSVCIAGSMWFMMKTGNGKKDTAASAKTSAQTKTQDANDTQTKKKKKNK